MTRHYRVLFAIALALHWSTGCSDDGAADPDAMVPDAAGNPDAAPDIDAPTPLPDAAPDIDAAPGAPTHIVLSEITLQRGTKEFIEIYNPTGAAVDLTNYYLSDDHEYWRLPATFSSLGAGAQDHPSINPDFDFILKFPNGASIAPGEVQVIALDHSEFMSGYAMEPDYSYLNTTGLDVGMVDPSGDSGTILVGATPSLTNGGESVILFYWDGASDLVQDVDMINVGVPSAPNTVTSKAGEMVDGPDADEAFSSYVLESALIGNTDGTAGDNFSHKRILLEAGAEPQDGTSNGITGDDEAGEDFRITWDNTATFSAPTPGVVPKSLM